MTKAEGAIKALASQQSDQMQKLVQSLLAAAQTTSDPQVASRATVAAASITQSLRREKTPASPEFFQSAFANLNAAETRIGSPAFGAKIALAEYRSSLATIQIPKTVMLCSGDASKTPGSGPMRNMTLKGCAYRLDDNRLGPNYFINVVFVDSRIIYKGGQVELDNVLFVNCTFEVTPNAHGSQLLEYAALDRKQLSVG